MRCLLSILIVLLAVCLVKADDPAPQPTPADDEQTATCDDQTCVRGPLVSVLVAPARVVAAPVRGIVKVHKNRVAVRQCRRAHRRGC